MINLANFAGSSVYTKRRNGDEVLTEVKVLTTPAFQPTIYVVGACEYSAQGHVLYGESNGPLDIVEICPADEVTLLKWKVATPTSPNNTDAVDMSVQVRAANGDVSCWTVNNVNVGENWAHCPRWVEPEPEPEPRSSTSEISEALQQLKEGIARLSSALGDRNNIVSIYHDPLDSSS